MSRGKFTALNLAHLYGSWVFRKKRSTGEKHENIKYKESAHTDMEVENPHKPSFAKLKTQELWRSDSVWDQNPEKPNTSSWNQEGNAHFFFPLPSFSSVQTLCGLEDATHTGRENLLYWVSSSNAPLIWKQMQPEIRFIQISGHSLIQSNWHKINCHNYKKEKSWRII